MKQDPKGKMKNFVIELERVYNRNKGRKWLNV